MTDVKCTGKEKNLFDCRYTLDNDCTGAEAAGVKCKGSYRKWNSDAVYWSFHFRVLRPRIYNIRNDSLVNLVHLVSLYSFIFLFAALIFCRRTFMCCLQMCRLLFIDRYLHLLVTLACLSRWSVLHFTIFDQLFDLYLYSHWQKVLHISYLQ